MAKGALDGLDLWYKALIPALFPFMILSNVIINLNLTEGVNMFMRPLTFILKLKKEAGYGIFAGLFFGYPACAAACCNLVKKNTISKEDANICIASFNNVSPAFLSGFVCMEILENANCFLPVFLIFYSCTLITSFIIRYIIFQKYRDTYTSVAVPMPQKSALIDKSILSALKNIGKLGGYIIIFSILSHCIMSFIPFHPEILCMLIEITTGLTVSDRRYLTFLPFISLGGVCGMFQTFSVDENNIIDKKIYILGKFISAFITMAVCGIVILFQS
ncbi:hypothetical protein [Eshraghiella crossota]|jgi:hypothetical protein